MILRLTLALFLAFVSAWASAQNDLGKELRARMENRLPQDQIRVKTTELKNSAQIQQFYSSAAFEPVWVNGDKLKPNALNFIQAIHEVRYDGLEPKDYHEDLIRSYAKSNPGLNAGELADMELLLSDAFFQVSKDLHEGKVSYKDFQKDWQISPKVPRYHYPDLLSEAKSGVSIESIFEKLYPDFQIYANSRQIVKNLFALAEQNTQEWKDLNMRGAIRLGEQNKIVPALRDRLAFWGYLDQWQLSENLTYDSILMEGVKAFQRRNGMVDDGIIGKLTLNALNQSPRDLLDKAAVNMERLRWLPDTVKSGPLVLVNIANYQLDFLHDRDTLLSERVIVGKRYHESPIFTADMSYIVFSPYWNLPYSIMRNEILPKARKDPSYISAKNMEIVDNSGNVISPSAVDWSSKSFPYRLRQKPGETNSLGLVKFIFPNNHSVYIHDTPARSLFEKEERAMSHGCIRVENPADLAAILLADKPEWTKEKIFDAMHQSKEETVYLKNKIPVVLLYLTFWVDGGGQGHFRPDIYERDAKLLVELRK